ncbi:MAG: type II toxin-antitoxin system YafQ family toxin [Huintestinicola sp.]|uniref:type II toxin-antitoxin system YafQ family toxin n=1 Tax=Huintestinicola sp. TaxID=2981661 RepID=UPI003F0599C0
MNYQVIWTSQFKKEYKLAMKRKLDISLLDNIIISLSKGEELPPERHDHDLSGNWKGYRECHIQPDWLLIYKIQNDSLVLSLTRTGTHSDLFDK